MKTRNILLTLLFAGSLCSFLYVNYDFRMNRNTGTAASDMIIEDEDEVSSDVLLPDVELLYKAGQVVKHLLPVSE